MYSLNYSASEKLKTACSLIGRVCPNGISYSVRISCLPGEYTPLCPLTIVDVHLFFMH